MRMSRPPLFFIAVLSPQRYFNQRRLGADNNRADT